MLTVNYILGEDKYVRLLLHSPHDEPFEIGEAHYELKLYEETEESGSAIIDGHEIGVRLCPKNRGTYDLIFTYSVADTVRKVPVGIVVS